MNKAMNIIIFILFAIGFSFSSCEKTDPPKVVTLPENINLEVNKQYSTVNVTVSADLANFYSVVFYHNNDSTVVESTDGLASHTYTATGTYLIKAKAHTDYENYIQAVDSVYINTDADTSIGYTTPLTYPGMTLFWNDEFDGNSLSADWILELGNGDWGWGNNELQYYTNSNHVVENGMLRITAKNQNVGSQNYSSTRMKTQGNVFFTYGRIDIRAKLPKGKGIWPALWMLGEQYATVGWPSCGEIDIMELVGGGNFNDSRVYGTVHWNDNGHAQWGNGYSLSSGLFNDEFHVFSIIWTDQSINWYVDDVFYHSIDITPASLSEFHEDFFLIFNIAVGGTWPGSPDATTVFPQDMYVDYVRVFQ